MSTRRRLARKAKKADIRRKARYDTEWHRVMSYIPRIHEKYNNGRGGSMDLAIVQAGNTP